jgi:hypothetical protein
MPRTLLVSASDAQYFYLLEELLDSAAAGVKKDGLDVGVLDVGFAEGQRAKLEQRGVMVREAANDFDPAMFRTAPPPFFRAMTARPFLPRYFPGYDLYLFLDADCWVQEWEAARLYLTTALAMGMAITPEVDRSYSPRYASESVAEFRWNMFRQCFAEDVARQLAEHPTINTGLFAARADSNVWTKWADLLDHLYRTIGEPFFYAEQAALNALIRSAVVRAGLLPARCNWMCNRATPFTRNEGTVLCEPQPPFAPLGMVHLAGPNKDTERELAGVEGRTYKRTLRFQRARV